MKAIAAVVVLCASVYLATACNCWWPGPGVDPTLRYCDYRAVFYGVVIDERVELADQPQFDWDVIRYTVRVDAPIFMPLELLGKTTVEIQTLTERNSCGTRLPVNEPRVFCGSVASPENNTYVIMDKCDPVLTLPRFQQEIGSQRLSLSDVCGERPITHVIVE